MPVFCYPLEYALVEASSRCSWIAVFKLFDIRLNAAPCGHRAAPLATEAYMKTFPCAPLAFFCHPLRHFDLYLKPIKAAILESAASKEVLDLAGDDEDFDDDDGDGEGTHT